MPARLLTATVLAAALAATTALPSGAAAPVPQVTDATGDANGINNQDTVNVEVPSQSTPAASPAGLDITSVLWSTKFTGSGKKKTATHVLVTMTLAGPVSAQSSGVWRATSAIDGCFFYLTYVVWPDAATPSASARICADNIDGYVDSEATAAASGNKIVWTLTVKAMKGFGAKLGSVIDDLGGHTRLALGAHAATGGATIPQIDDATSTKAYKVGS